MRARTLVWGLAAVLACGDDDGAPDGDTTPGDARVPMDTSSEDAGSDDSGETVDAETDAGVDEEDASEVLDASEDAVEEPCGNGVLDEGEACDTGIESGDGVCPASCDDGDTCTTDAASGSDCTLTCAHEPITVCADADGCCLTTCAEVEDDDCSASCGNEVIETGETCDPPSACPTSCDESDPCRVGTLMGDAASCTASCSYESITACTNGDGCCPEGCDATSDDSCSASCDNGTLEPGETCDPRAMCPTSCNDSMACTSDTLVGSATNCNARCVHRAITGCTAGDGCCPTGCNQLSDGDCTPMCGNGVTEMGETCDGDCPASCNDMVACTTDARSGSPARCNVRCTHAAITACGAADGCCAPGCSSLNDPDCPPVCGNGIVEAGETCDDANAIGYDGCSAVCQPEVAFRLDDMYVRDPHLFARIFLLGCRDITDMAPLMQPGVNAQFNEAITMDTPDDMGMVDGLLDLSILIVLSPLDQTTSGDGRLDLILPDCTAPVGTTMCSHPDPTDFTASAYMNQGAGTCLGVLPGTTTGYTPPVQDVTASPGNVCFVSAPVHAELDIQGVIIPLEDAQVSARYTGSPATALSGGLLRGFLTEASAQASILPMGLPVVGGMPLYALLRGGGGCGSGDDSEMGPDGSGGTTHGWWFYLNFTTATRVPLD